MCVCWCWCWCWPGSDSNISLPLAWDPATGLQAKDGLVPTEVLPLSYALLQAWIEEKQQSYDVRVFHWDWRRSLHESAAGFQAFMDAQGLCGPGVDGSGSVGGGAGSRRQAVLVTHSTGSVIAWPAVNAGPSRFRAWVSVSGALGPGPNALKDLHHGWAIDLGIPCCFRSAFGGGPYLVDAETSFTHPSLYFFFSSTPDERGRRNM